MICNNVWMNQKVKVEVCVDSVVSALAAERGGADRIELCGSLVEGGITPSVGLIETVRQSISIPMHVMIRPRGGDFLYDGPELEIMRRDIAAAKRLGADGVVFGVIDVDGKVNVTRTLELVEVARPLAVTFHRAFDMTADLFEALEDVCATGADRLLTSGAEQTSLEGAATIAALLRKAQGRIVVMPGSGIKPGNVRDLVKRTGAREIHVGLRSSVPSAIRYRNPRVSLGPVPAREYERQVVLEENVRQLCDELR